MYSLNGNDFGDFGVEQQAQIIADYHSLLYLQNLPGIGHIMRVNNIDIARQLKEVPNEKALDKTIRTPEIRDKWLEKYHYTIKNFLNHAKEYQWQKKYRLYFSLPQQ